MMDALFGFLLLCGLFVVGIFLGYNITSSNLKKMDTSISTLHELKKECELHLPRTQKCKIIFVGDL